MDKKSEAVTLIEFVGQVINEVMCAAENENRGRIKGEIKFEVSIDRIEKQEDKTIDIFVLTHQGGISKKEIHKIKFAIDFDKKPLTISDVLNALEPQEDRFVKKDLS